MSQSPQVSWVSQTAVNLFGICSPLKIARNLRDEYLTPYGITAKALSKGAGIPESRLCEIFAGRRGISADTAIRLGRFISLDPQFFINLQGTYDRITAEIALENQRPPVRIKPFDFLKRHQPKNQLEPETVSKNCPRQLKSSQKIRGTGPKKPA
ncbi:MAG: HigA family addiction module antidote protein [Puniceicoccales bacterium]|jgi:addiction module HigA family antidote|nr:HigA family addiction module antidote protein [Puniceicoccales bacterium]